jgi:hypothetical protein
MKRFVEIILTLLLAIILSFGASTLFGCGQEIEPDGDDLPIVLPDGPEDGDGGNNGGGDGNDGGGNDAGGGEDGPTNPSGPSSGGGGGSGSDINLHPMPVP